MKKMFMEIWLIVLISHCFEYLYFTIHLSNIVSNFGVIQILSKMVVGIDNISV